MKKRNFKALALSALLLGLVVAAPAHADEEQVDETQMMLAAGSCGGGNGGGCHGQQQPNKPTTQPNNTPNTPNNTNQPQDQIKKRNGGSCSGILASGCGCGKDKNNETHRQKLLA